MAPSKRSKAVIHLRLQLFYVSLSDFVGLVTFSMYVFLYSVKFKYAHRQKFSQ